MTRCSHINIHGDRCIRPTNHNNSHRYLFEVISEKETEKIAEGNE